MSSSSSVNGLYQFITLLNTRAFFSGVAVHISPAVLCAINGTESYLGGHKSVHSTKKCLLLLSKYTPIRKKKKKTHVSYIFPGLEKNPL